MAEPHSSHALRRHRLYEQLTLRGPIPRRILWHPTIGATAPDPIANALRAEKTATDRLLASAQANQLTYHRFGWLLAAYDQPRDIQRTVQNLTERWINIYGGFHPHHWGAAVCAERLTNLLFGMGILLEGQDGPWRDSLLSLVAQHIRHLRRIERRIPVESDDGLAVATARALAVMCLPDDPTFGDPMSPRLNRILQRLADGVLPHSWRFPVRLLSDLRRLEALSGAFVHRRISPPPALADAASTAREAFSLGLAPDGTLAPWAGTSQLQIPVIKTTKETASLARRHSDTLGRWRLTANPTTVLVDAGHRRDPLGAGSFILYDEMVPLIVNCGTPSALAVALCPGMAHWREALASAAAGSTLDQLDDVPGTTRLEDGEEGHLIELQRSRGNDLHRRRLLLRPDGKELLGEDLVSGACDPVLYRFHLAPGVDAEIDETASRVTFGPANTNALWVLKTSHALVSLDESVHAAVDGTTVPTKQIVIKPHREGLRWAIRRTDA